MHIMGKEHGLQKEGEETGGEKEKNEKRNKNFNKATSSASSSTGEARKKLPFNFLTATSKSHNWALQTSPNAPSPNLLTKCNCEYSISHLSSNSCNLSDQLLEIGGRVSLLYPPSDLYVPIITSSLLLLN